MTTITKAGLTLAAVAAVPAVWCAPAYGDASPNAACTGTEASYYSPPGSSDVYPGGMRDAVHDGVFVYAEWLDLTPGQIIAYFGTAHLGSHDACNAQS